MVQLPFWSANYVGSGPYRLRENAAGLRIILEAFDKFVLGRPKIDEIDLVYTPDPNTVAANILAGSTDLTVGIGLTVDQAIDLRDRWREGKMTFEFSDQRWFRLDPQFIDPNPAIVTDLRFRRALLHAIDRQELADSLQGGLSPVAHTFMAPEQPDYAGIEHRVMKYDYDPRKAVQMIEELGYRRGADGSMRDAAGRAIELEIAGSNEAVTRTMLAVGDYWQRIGVASAPFVVPPQRASDWPWRATFAAFAMFTGTHDIPGLPAFRGRQARTAANNYEVSGLPNWPRYQSAELDNLVDTFFRTVPKAERIEVITQINMHIAENLNTIGLYYFPIPYAVANRLTNIPTNRASRASLTWNAHLWDVH
jgi:peptide/nickel transport system substrate-binding protein